MPVSSHEYGRVIDDYRLLPCCPDLLTFSRGRLGTQGMGFDVCLPAFGSWRSSVLGLDATGLRRPVISLRRDQLVGSEFPQVQRYAPYVSSSLLPPARRRLCLRFSAV